VGKTIYGKVLRMLSKSPSRTYRDMADTLHVAPSTVGVAVAHGLDTGDLKRDTCPTCGSAVLTVQPKEE
jgi:hypothetical protein